MNRACENRFRKFYLIKINIFMIVEVEEINSPLHRTYQRLYIKNIYNSLFSFILGTVIKGPFLASEHRGRDQIWLSVRCWEKHRI